MSGRGLAGDRETVAGQGISGSDDQQGELDNPDPAAGIAFALEQVMDQAYNLILQRHRKYGPKNIANSPGGPLVGILVRLHDKLARLTFGMQDFTDESVEDAFKDVLGYAAIALLVLRGEWPT